MIAALLLAGYTWLAEAPDPSRSLMARIPPPAGFQREPAEPGSFAAWLRGLPLKPGTPPVRLFDGRLKANQDAHAAVFDIDAGTRDLQQCADAVIRLRAEWLYAGGRSDAIAFRFTSGDVASFARWAAGERPAVSGTRVTWRRRAAADASRTSFRRYLDTVFTYAGSLSLARETVAAAAVEAGDMFVHGGSPGHAVLVVDTAVDPRTGRRVFLLAQSYMPAQEIQLLRNPAGGVWYDATLGARLLTPEWAFDRGDLRRWPRVSPRTSAFPAAAPAAVR